MDALNATGFAAPGGPQSIPVAQSAGTDAPSGGSEPVSGATSVGTESGSGFGATLAKVSQGGQQDGQKGKAASEKEANELHADSDLLTEATSGLVILASLIVPVMNPVVNQEQGTGQESSQDAMSPVVADGSTGSPVLLPIAQATSASQDVSVGKAVGKAENSSPVLSAPLQEAGSPASLIQGASAPAQTPEVKSPESHLSGAVLQPEVLGNQVVADSLLGGIPSSDALTSAASSNPDQQTVQVLSVHPTVGKSPQAVVNQPPTLLNGKEEVPNAGRGSDYVVQTLSKESAQSAPGEQFLERDGHGDAHERGANQGQGEVQGEVIVTPSLFDTSAHGAEVLIRPGEAPFRSELTKAVEGAAPVPVQPPATVVSNTGGTMRLQFDPPDLGRVTVQVSVQAQQVHATVSVQHQGLGEFLATSQGALDDAMRQHGLRVEEFRVDTDTSQGQQFGEHLPGFQDREGGSASGRPEGSNPSLVEVGSGETADRGLSLNRINLFA